MTSQKDQIQALIAEIDTVLQKTSPRLPWVMSGEATQQRQVLERVRNYLVAFQTRPPAEGAIGQPDPRSDLLAHDIYYRVPSSPSGEANLGSEQRDELTPQQMLQAVMQEMSYLRTSLMQPLRQDLDGLRQQRDVLTQEIQQLEAQRRQYELNQGGVNQQQLVGDFLQVLMGRLQESLAQQVAQTLENLQHQALPTTNHPVLTGESELTTAATPQLAQLQALQSRSDQLLVGLDSSLRVVFESLQQSIQAYQESLTQGVDRLHTLGQQGEVMVNALLSHLAQRLGQEASSYLQSSAHQLAGLETSQIEIDSLRAFPEVSPPNEPSRPSVGTGSAFPYPGIELPPPDAGSPVAESSVPLAPVVDTAIESWLQSVSAANQSDTLDLGESGLAALDLSQLELGQVDASNLDAILSLDLNLTDANASVGTDLFSPDTLADLPASATGSETALEDSAAQLAELGLGSVTEEDTEDIDAALQLLEQLSQELQDQTQTLSIADAEATLDRIIAPPPTSTTAVEPQANISEDARDELDEFYESFFGTDTEVPSGADLELPLSEPTIAMESPPLADQDWGTDMSLGGADSELELAEFAAADDLLSLPDLDADSDRLLVLDENVSELPGSPTSEASLEDMLFGEAVAEGSPIDLPVPDSAADSTLSEPNVAEVPAIPEPDPANWLPEPNFLDSFFDEQDAIARSESVADLEVDLKSTDLATLEGETGVPDQIGSLTELSDLFPESVQPTLPDATAEMAARDRFPSVTDLPVGTSLDLEISIPVDQGFAASESRRSADTITGSDDLYILAAPEEDLLPTNPLDDDLDFNLDLDEAILSRLSADLSNLEALADQTTQMLDNENSPETFSVTLDDWTMAAAAPVEPEPASSSNTWQEESLEEFAAAIPAAEPELEPAAAAESEPEPEISYADLSLEEFATALPELPLSASEPSLEDFGEDFDRESAESELAFPELTTGIPEATLVEPELSLEEFATALKEPSSETDWQTASFEEFAAGIPEPASELAIADIEPSLEDPAALSEAPLPEGELSLEAFATALGQVEATPMLPSEAPDALLDELFAESAVPESIAASPGSPAIEPPLPFTLQGMDDLFGETTLPATSPPPLVTPLLPDEPLPFTLEGMDSLFEDVPPVASKVELPRAEPPPSIAPPVEPTPAPDSPFTQENIENLFNRHQPSQGGSNRLSAKTAQPNSPAFTLAGMDDLFDDAPPVPPANPTVSEPAKPTVEAPPSSHVPTLERIDHLFDEVAPWSAGMAPPSQANTLASSIADLFEDAPVSTPIEPAPNSEAPLTEPLEGLEDLLEEATDTVPAPLESPSPTVADLADFTLEGMEDLFVEPPTKSSAAATPRSTTTSSSAAIDALVLDEAFESLLGLPATDAASTSAPEVNPPTPEKKKKAR